jgi:hypothetical protein
MPRKSKKACAKSAYHAIKKTDLHDYDQGITRRVFGTFHQGDVQFSSESRGMQCPCNALVMLCNIEKTFDLLHSSHLDDILRGGDLLYQSTARKLGSASALADDRYLATDQLPKNFTLGDSIYKVHYEPVRYGRLYDNPNSALEPLDVELETSFTISCKNILIFDSYMMAIYKDPRTNTFVFFDSHSRDESGLPIADGTAVTLFFNDFQHVHKYLNCLAVKLNSRIFGIVSLDTQESTHSENEPRCSTFSDITCLSSAESSRHVQAKVRSNNVGSKSSSTQRLSRYQKWIQSLSTEGRNDLLDKKRKRSTADYASPEKGQRKRHQTKQGYQNPETAERKKQHSKEAYQDPEKAERKKQQARGHSHKTYQDPGKAERKKRQARGHSHKTYQDPGKAERKKRQARGHSHETYQNPEKARRKRKQAREKSRQNYNNPEHKALKIKQSQANRSRKLSNIEAVITRFKTSCKEGQQLTFTCEICQRINFRHQVKILRQENYNKRILLRSLPINRNIEEITNVEDRDDHKTWICNTCHSNMKSNLVPKLATVNGLKVEEQPPELSQLNMLERHLISPAIPFMKMVSLIKGAQKGVHGQIVCVKADVNSVAQSLPRLPTDQSLIRVKLKRKLEYKGHHMCQDISPSKIREALTWLKEHNPEYEDIDINFDNFDGMLNDQLIHTDQCEEHDDSCNIEEHEYIEDTTDNSADMIDNHADDVDNYADDVDHYADDSSGNHDSDNDDYHHDTSNESEVTDATDNFAGMIDSHADDADNYADDNRGNHDSDNDEHHHDKINDHDVQDESEVTDPIDENGNDVTNTSAPLYSFLHPVDFAQYLADKHDTTILSVAPGEGNKPERVLDMEAKCFPVEFPDGSNTYSEKRKQKLSPSRYFNSRLFSVDNRFSRNPEYIFFGLYATEVHQIHSNVSIATRIGSTKTSDGREITASMLRDREQVKQLIKRDDGYRFLTQIGGTPAYWERSKRDLFAMIRQLGIPTFFVTFSAADRRWIEIDNAILKTLGKPPMTPEEHQNMTWEQHCDIIMSNPVAAAKMFQERVHTFMKDVIMSEANPIGEVEDYYYRTEFQQRGWPHIHMVVWVKNAPKLNEDPEEEVISFIDKYISCEVPPEVDAELREVVTSVQTHSKNHTKSCRKTGKKCRFNFPKPPCNRTFICHPLDPVEQNDDNASYQKALEERLDQEKKAKETLGEIWKLLEDPTQDFSDFDQVLRAAGTTQAEFEKLLETLSKKQTIYLKRRVGDQWINNYNPHLIRCWNGNMDIQYVLDPYACVMYIVSYITKAEREMGDLLRNAQREAAEGNNDAVQQLRKLGSVYLQNREVSVMGAIYLICSMPLRKSTRKVIFLQTGLDGQRISLPLRQLQANADNSEQVWMSTHIDKYLARPNTAKYNNMCMATFFSSHYQVSSKSDNINADPDEETDDEPDDETSDPHNRSVQQDSHTVNSMPLIQLQNLAIKMKERKRKPAVIRYPRVSMKKDTEKYHMNMLRLYLPHTSEIIKPNSFPTYESYHMTGYTIINNERVCVKDVVEQNMTGFEPKTAELDEAWEGLHEAADMQDAWATIAPQSEQQRLDDTLEHVVLNESDDDLNEIEVPELQPGNRSHNHDNVLPRCAIESCNPEITEEQAESMMRQLNDKQRQLFNHVSKWCNEKARDHRVLPFHIFVSGGAGTGKSHVIKCIKYYAQKAFASMCESVDDITVLLVAHTGTAAFNISGETICSAFKIGSRTPKDYRPLGEQTLNTLRTKYQHLQLVIIDEISMVSVTQLSYIHGRLQQIKGASDRAYFGNVSILAVGDFYQLPPISPPTPLCIPHVEILKDLWNPLFQTVELTEIMRQRDDAIFANMLNRLRVRRENEPLEEEDKKLLQSRAVETNSLLQAPTDALHLFYLNKDVDSHNDTKLASLNTEVFTIKAEDVDQKGGRVIKVHESPHTTSRKDDTSLAPCLKLAVGARTMLIANVDVSDGLSNGVSGIIEGIEFGNAKNMPKVVYVKFDSVKVGIKIRASKFILPQYSSCVPITPRKETFQLKGKSYTTTREQIPLKLAWAVTIHKVQGQTTEQAVISMKGLRRAMAYVALSRVTTLQGLYLVDFDPSRIYCNPDIARNLVHMPLCDLSRANRMLHIDYNKYFVIAHHNIQSLNRHIEDLKNNTEIRKAHVICLSETWLTDESNQDALAIEGYSLQSINSTRGRGVAIYIQNGVNYTLVPIPSDTCDALAIRTHGSTNMLITVIYKPVGINTRTFRTEMNNITAQTDLVDTDYTVFVGDFNYNLMDSHSNVVQPLSQYHQVITDCTTANGTLLDHIYVKPCPPICYASVLTTYYSYHNPVFIAIRN